MKVAILIPCMDYVHSRFAQSLADMIAETMRPAITFNGQITRPQIKTLVGDIGGLEYKRTHLAMEAIRAGADYLLWCDSDHIVPSDALLTLAKHDLPIVGCNYLRRTPPHLPTALGADGEPVQGRGLQEVAAIGFGLCLMKAPIFDRVPKPWFASEIGEDGRSIRGEDVHFCNQARAAGIPVIIDHDLRLGHLATQTLFIGENVDAGSVLSASGP